MVKFNRIFTSLCGWKIGQGDVSFWYDNWNPEFTIDFPHMEDENKVKLKEFFQDWAWNFDDIVPIVEEEVKEKVVQVAPVLTEARDIILWGATPSGTFSLRSAWEAIRRRGTPSLLLSRVWEVPITLEAKVLVWRMIKQIIPVDTIVKKQRIQLASKCVCCAQPQEESIHHLFKLETWLRRFGHISVWSLEFLTFGTNIPKLSWLGGFTSANGDHISRSWEGLRQL